jgi:Meiotically up-regulated gene 113
MGVVYALQHGTEEKFKIGMIRAGTAEARRKALSTGNPNRLKLVAEIETEHHNACERYLHNTLGAKRIGDGDGTEWFAVSLGELQSTFARARQYMAEYADDLADY